MSTTPDSIASTASTTEGTKPSREELLRDLSQFTGSLDRYRHWSGRLIYTPGVQHLAEQAGAHWLIDLVASWQLDPKLATEDFQAWKLTVRPDRTATAAVTDGNDANLATQDIPFTDFPLEEVDLWLVEGTLLLPSEY